MGGPREVLCNLRRTRKETAQLSHGLSLQGSICPLSHEHWILSMALLGPGWGWGEAESKSAFLLLFLPLSPANPQSPAVFKPSFSCEYPRFSSWADHSRPVVMPLSGRAGQRASRLRSRERRGEERRLPFTGQRSCGFQPPGHSG